MTEIRDMWVTPGPKPNGLQAAADGLWVIDQTDHKKKAATIWGLPRTTTSCF